MHRQASTRTKTPPHVLNIDMHDKPDGPGRHSSMTYICQDLFSHRSGPISAQDPSYVFPVFPPPVDRMPCVLTCCPQSLPAFARNYSIIPSPLLSFTATTSHNMSHLSFNDIARLHGGGMGTNVEDFGSRSAMASRLSTRRRNDIEAHPTAR